MNLTSRIRRPRRLALVAAAAAVAVTAGVLADTSAGARQPSAGSTGNEPTSPAAVAAAAHTPKVKGPPAPAGFAAQLKKTYAEELSYAGLPGVTPSGSIRSTSALTSAATFDRTIDGLSPAALTEAYDQGPSAWAQVSKTMDQLTAEAPPSKVASAIGRFDQALPTTPGTVTKLATGDRVVAAAAADGTSYTPPTPVVFNGPSCPSYNLGGDDGYDALYGLQLAVDATSILAVPDLPFGAAAPGIAVVFALQLSLNTISLLVNLSQACGNASTASEVDTLNGNTIDLDNTTIALLELDNQIQAQEESIEALLDSRTTTIINGLDTAQASLDTAQTQAIEEALAGGSSTAIASYELPSSLGGYLDSTPIGVQAIVTTALANLQQANQPVNPAAPGLLAEANNDLAAGNFKTAFGEYQAAYQAINH